LLFSRWLLLKRFTTATIAHRAVHDNQIITTLSTRHN
jgi:hypothetical protein